MWPTHRPKAVGQASPQASHPGIRHEVDAKPNGFPDDAHEKIRGRQRPGLLFKDGGENPFDGEGSVRGQVVRVSIKDAVCIKGQ